MSYQLRVLALAAILCAVRDRASAGGFATASATLVVTGAIESSISLTIESAGGTISGAGTALASAALGTVSRFGAAPPGFTVARSASSWTLSSTIGVRVDKANLTSSDYTLTAQLGAAPAPGVTWRLDGQRLSDAAPTTLTRTGSYGAAGRYAWDIAVANAAAAATSDATAGAPTGVVTGALIDNAVAFTAIAN
jgi:hypothetical protein